MDAIRISSKGVVTIPFSRVGVAEIDLGAMLRVAQGKTIMVKGDLNRGRFQ